jgi:hypothetical protein
MPDIFRATTPNSAQHKTIGPNVSLGGSVLRVHCLSEWGGITLSDTGSSATHFCNSHRALCGLLPLKANNKLCVFDIVTSNAGSRPLAYKDFAMIRGSIFFHF